MLRRIGPSVRTSTARSIARATAGGSGDEDDLAALTAHAQDPVAVFLTEITDVGSAGFEDPQSEQTQHRDEGEVIRVGRQPGGGEQGFELQKIGRAHV